MSIYPSKLKEYIFNYKFPILVFYIIALAAIIRYISQTEKNKASIQPVTYNISAIDPQIAAPLIKQLWGGAGWLGFTRVNVSSRSNLRNQRVIAYSLFKPPGEENPEEFSGYTKGIRPNLDALRRVYNSDEEDDEEPWRMRIYSDLELTPEIISLLEEYPELDWIDMSMMPQILKDMNKMSWRFLAFGDPRIRIYLSRDLDGILTEREKSAVDEWLQSDYILHVMRDHPYHNRVILGGLWGIKNDQIPLEKVKSILSNLIVARGMDNDQDILDKFIWSEFRFQAMAHDSYHCKDYESYTLPWPTERVGRKFVGGRIFRFEDTDIIRKECPKVCRPSYGQDWDYC